MTLSTAAGHAAEAPALDKLAAWLFAAIPPSTDDSSSLDVDDTVLRHALVLLAAPQRRAKCSKLLRERHLVPWVADALDAFPATAAGDGVAHHLVPTGSKDELDKATALFRALVAAMVVLGFPGDTALVADVLGPEYVNTSPRPAEFDPPGSRGDGDLAADSFGAILDVAHDAQELLGPEATTGNLVDAVMGAIRSVMGSAFAGGALEQDVEVGLSDDKVAHEATLQVMAALPLVTIVVENPGPRQQCIQLLRLLAEKEDDGMAGELAVVLSTIGPTVTGQLARTHFSQGSGSPGSDTMLVDKGWTGHHFLWVAFLVASALVRTTGANDASLRSLLVALIDEDPEQAARSTGGSASNSSSSGGAASGYRWSRSSPGDAATRVNITPRAAAASPAEAPDVKSEETEAEEGGGMDFDGWKPPPLPPPPPPLPTLLGAPTPIQAAPAPAPVKAKGFGGAAAKAKPVAVLEGGDHKSDKALLVAAERQFYELLDWYNAHVTGGQYLAIVSARCKPPAPGAACPEPALCDWLPLCCAMFVDGAVLRGGDMEVSLVDGIPALLVGTSQLRNVAMAALRFAVPTTAVKKLTWADLDWAYETLPSADAAYITARKAGATAVDDVTNAVRVLGIPPGDATNRAAVRSAYRKAAAQSHPDQSTGDAERFSAVQAAYELLTQRAATAVDTSMREGLTSGTATGYAAWDSSRRSFEGPLRLPASPDEAAASMAKFGGLGCAAMVLGNDGVEAGQEQTKFFARRNTFAFKQAAAAAEGAAQAAAAAEKEKAKHDSERQKQEAAEQELRAAAQADAQEAAQEARQAAVAAKEQALKATEAAKQQAAKAAAQATAAANAASATAKRAAGDAMKRAAASTAAAVVDAASATATAAASTVAAATDAAATAAPQPVAAAASRAFVSRKATQAATPSIPARAPAPTPALSLADKSELAAFLDELELEGAWRREVETIFAAEGVTKVSHIALLELEDLLNLGVRRIPARLLLKAAQKRVSA